MSKVRSKNMITRAAVSVAALGVAAAVGGVAATQPGSISASLVDLSALIVVGSSTNPDGTGNETFFGGTFNQAPYNPGGQPGPDLIGVDFRAGITAIDAALQANSGQHNAVLTSGWGAANASLLLTRLDRDDDPALPTSVFVLDNNVSRPDGGFGTRYPLFALIGVNPFPSPADTTAQAVIDIAYQYNYNSNAPADLLNLAAHLNSLIAYLYGYQDQATIDLPVHPDGTPAVSCGAANTCAVLAGGGDALPCEDARCDTPAGDRITAYVTTRGNTTYVTYTTDELPLARLIRDVVPLGGVLADLTEPLLKVIVDSAYYDGNPIPSDPSRYRPARLAPSLGELIDTASKVPGAIRDGLETLSDNTSEPETAGSTPPEPHTSAKSTTRAQRTHVDGDLVAAADNNAAPDRDRAPQPESTTQEGEANSARPVADRADDDDAPDTSVTPDAPDRAVDSGVADRPDPTNDKGDDAEAGEGP